MAFVAGPFVPCMDLGGARIGIARWFGLLGRLAPIGLDGPSDERMVRVRPFASGLLTGRWTRPLVVLAAVGTASIIFDGLSQTEPWFRVFG